MPTPRQTSFAGGELAQSLWGRTDLARYPSGARRLFNFFVSKQGNAVSRPGTEFMCLAWGGVADTSAHNYLHPEFNPPKVWSSVGNLVRLLPFKWSDTDTSQNCIIEFGDRYLRILENGLPVRIDPYIAGQPGNYSAGTSYSAAVYVIYGGFSYLSLDSGNLGHQPDISPTWWTPINAVWSSGTIYNVGDQVLYAGHLYRTIQGVNLNHQPDISPAWFIALDGVLDSPYRVQDLEKIRYAQSGDIVSLACAGYPPYELSRVSQNAWTIALVNFARPAPSPAISVRLMEASYGAVDASHPAQAWNWVVTEISRDSRGLTIESAPVKLAFGLVWWGDRWNPNIPYMGINTSPVNGGTVVSHADAVRDTYWTCLTSNTGTDPGALIDSVNGYSGGSSGGAWFVHGKTTGFHSDWLYPLGAVTQSGGIYYRSLGGANIGHAPPNATWWTPLADDGITGHYQQDNLASFQDVFVCLYPDRQLQLWICPATTSASYNFICYRVYRGRAGVYGWVGDTNPGDPTSSTVQLFVDAGAEPDYSLGPPQGLNPFEVHSDSGALTRTETPIAVCFFGDRRIYAGTPERPAFIFGSAVGDYANFDQRITIQDDDAVVFGLASRQREFIRSVIGLQKVLVLTDASAWAAEGAQGAPLAPDSIDARVQVDVGADWPMPLVVEGAVLWVRNKGTGVRRIAYDTLRQSFTSSDLSMVSEHLLVGHKIVDWCYAEDPWGVVWAVRDDGVLLSLTYAPQEELWAWAQHGVCPDANGNPGVIQSIATVPEGAAFGDEDAVYLAVTGGGGGSDAAWILRMWTRLEVAPQDPTLQQPIKLPVSLDAFVAPGILSAVDRMTLNGLDQFEGRPVWALVKSGFQQQYTPYGPVTVTSGQVVINRVPAQHSLWAEDVVLVGLPFKPELELLDLAEGRLGQKIVNEVGLEVKASGPLWAGESLTTVKEQKDITSEKDMVRVHIAGSWNTGGRAAIRQLQPLPLTVLGVTRKVENAR